jgi:hypothetical protein
MNDRRRARPIAHAIGELFDASGGVRRSTLKGLSRLLAARFVADLGRMNIRPSIGSCRIGQNRPEHDPQKWELFLRRDHAPNVEWARDLVRKMGTIFRDHALRNPSEFPNGLWRR